MIKQLAKQFLNSDNSEKKAILKQVKNYLSNSDELLNLSPNLILKTFRLSYFCGVNSSSKVEKGKKKNIDTIILYLSASKNAGFDVCKFASDFCRKVCLVESGRASMERHDGNIHVSRLVKTWIVEFAPKIAEKLILSDIDRAVKRGKEFVVRLNGTSDLNWSNIIKKRPSVQFYDYTKKPMESKFKNHHITFSFSGSNISQVFKMLDKNINAAVAIVASDFKKALKLPNTYNGDETDLRSYDKQKGKLCLLKIKGNNVKKNPFIMDYSEVKKIALSIG